MISAISVIHRSENGVRHRWHVVCACVVNICDRFLHRLLYNRCVFDWVWLWRIGPSSLVKDTWMSRNICRVCVICHCTCLLIENESVFRTGCGGTCSFSLLCNVNKIFLWCIIHFHLPLCRSNVCVVKRGAKCATWLPACVYWENKGVCYFTLVLFVYLSIIRLLAAASVTHCGTRTDRSPGDTHLHGQPRYIMLQ